MEKKINILGEDIVVRYNMAVQLAYEEITGNSFSIQDMSRKTSQMALFIAAILTNNPETNITMERMMTEATNDDFAKLDTAMGELIAEWYHLPDQVEKAIKEDNEKAKKRQARKGKDAKQKH